MAALGRLGTLNSLPPSILREKDVVPLRRSRGVKRTIRLSDTFCHRVIKLILFLSVALNLRYMVVTNNRSSDSMSAAAKAALKAKRVIINELDVVLQNYAEQDGPVKEFQPRLSPHDAREFVRRRFADAGVDLDNATLQSLPTWNDIVQNIGSAPRIYGLDQCERYRAKVPARKRFIGGAGMFNSGTNLLVQLLGENCKIPERVKYYGWNETVEKWRMDPTAAHGILWQVPWGKHTPARKRLHYTIDDFFKKKKKSVLPIVAIRHPYTWMASMCRHSYGARWQHPATCPHLVVSAESMKPVNVRVANDTYDSLAHLWNDWYHEYWKDAKFPFLMVRNEDLIFHAENVTTQVCQCAGGVIRTDQPFSHCVKSAKEFLSKVVRKDRTDMVGAWINYGKKHPIRGGFDKRDYLAARLFLDGELMQTFGYRHPQPL
ncbi:hypothetical protein MHU86_11612 [Fragilaria crotonensis]|nr:hypothetical protein MHU86_11612 [Fragilaria crotonensis]